MKKNKIIKKISPAILIFILVAGGFVSMVPPAKAALLAVGPLSTVHGFPVWYQDTTGLALQLCLGTNPDGTGPADPNCVLPTAGPLEPNFPPPFNVQSPGTSFPGESFWYIADAIRIGAGLTGAGRVRFRYALEAAFAVDPPAAGQQIAFLRVNLQPMADLVPGATYTVTHPFGQFTTAPADATGVVPLTRFEDGAFGPPLTAVTAASFLAAPNTNFGPFLRQVTPAPPVGYIGDAINESTIQAGPNGNFVRIDGPSIDVGNIDLDNNPNSLTINTWVVAGKIAVIDTVAPTIGTVTPATVAVNSTNVVLRANVTDDKDAVGDGLGGVTGVTVDLGALSNNFTANLSGLQEVPGPGSSGTGSGSFIIDTTANTLSFNISVNLPASDVETSAHIHNAPAGQVNGVAAFTLPNGATKTGVWNYPEALEPEILAGRTYVQIHSLLFPDGAIRGQISPTSNVQNMTLTSGTRANGTWSLIVPGTFSRLGTLNFPITATDGSNTAGINHILSVVPLLTAVNVTPAASTIIVGSTQQLTATALDPAGAPIVPTPSTAWTSSDTAVATVDNSGLVTAVGVGNATITATVNDGVTSLPNTATITVNPIPVLTSVVVTPATASIVISAGNFQLTASGLDQLGNPMALPVGTAWTSLTPALATVDATGLVTPLTAGTVTIRATNGVLFGDASLLVTTEPQVFTSVSVTPATATLTGGTQQLTATAIDQFGNAMAAQPAFAWASSNTAVATVNANSGLVTVLSAGNTTITVVSGALNASAAITVSDVLTTINVNPATITIGGTQQAVASALNQFGAPMTAVFAWTSNNAPVAAINPTSGLISAITAGTATITATSGLVSGQANVNVVLGPTLTTINLTSATSTIVIGGTQQLSAATLDQDGAPIAATLTWTSSGPAATVNASGLVTGAGAGTAVITATSGTVQGSVTITVQTPVLTTINITPASPSVTVGSTQQLSAAGLNQLGGSMALTGTTTWSSSNTGVGTVSDTGLFTAVAAGTTVVSAVNSTATGTVSVTVNAVPAPASSGGGAVIGGGGGGGGGGGFFLPPAQFQTTAVPPNPEVQRQIERQLEIEREFRIRQQGGGQVLGERIEFRQVQIQQIANEADMISAKNLIALLANAAASRQQTKETEIKIKFVAKLKTNLNGSLSQDDESAIANFITYGTANTKKLGEGERAGVLDSYKAAFGKLPTSKSQWEDALKIAVGRFPGEINTVAEARAKIEFKKIYLRDASMNNEKDKAAVSVMAYGLRPDRRNTNSEKASINTFRTVFKKSPGTATDWDKVRAIAYSGAKR